MRVPLPKGPRFSNETLAFTLGLLGLGRMVLAVAWELRRENLVGEQPSVRNDEPGLNSPSVRSRSWSSVGAGGARLNSLRRA
jgi:hypothetical protein